MPNGSGVHLLPYSQSEPVSAWPPFGLLEVGYQDRLHWTYTGRSDAVGDFARAVAARNYPVEQEAAIRSALLLSVAG